MQLIVIMNPYLHPTVENMYVHMRFEHTLEIKDLKIGIGIEKKSNETRLKIMLRIHLIISLSCILNTHQQIFYPMHTTEIPILTLHMGNSVPHISSFMNKVCIT